VGIGKTGNGYGIGYWLFSMQDNGSLQIDHDLDGYWNLEVFVVNNNTIELY